jgi:hypothetical protein
MIQKCVMLAADFDLVKLHDGPTWRWLDECRATSPSVRMINTVDVPRRVQTSARRSQTIQMLKSQTGRQAVTERPMWNIAAGWSTAILAVASLLGLLGILLDRLAAVLRKVGNLVHAWRELSSLLKRQHVRDPRPGVEPRPRSRNPGL